MYRLSPVVVCVLLLVAGKQSASADLPFLKDMAGDTALPRAYGIGIDLFTMDQGYDVHGLDVGLPGFIVEDPSIIIVENTLDYADVKFDAWVFPFLNVFAVLGTLEGETSVDLGAVALPQLPVPLGAISIDYDGTVYGAGFTGIYAQDAWFVSATASYTDSDLDGDFSSSVKTTTIQPRVGLRLDRTTLWLGATYLDAEENHSGVVDLGIPTLPPVPFDVELASSDKWNVNAGAQFQITPQLAGLVEFGFSGREHILANLTWRF